MSNPPMNYPAASSGVSIYNEFIKIYAASGGILDPGYAINDVQENLHFLVSPTGMVDTPRLLGEEKLRRNSQRL